MVRTLRYRQAISYVNKEARKRAYKKLELAMHGRNIYPNKRWKSLHVLSQTGTYRDNVNAYQMLMKDGDPTPTIPQARVMHTALGTWDAKTVWDSSWHFFDEETGSFYSKKGAHNRIFVRNGGQVRCIRTKADYKALKGLTQ
ncbi:hypothetical protein [Bacillus cereus]|uniref:hypothetical protein n=1 Tax=Bacillus cereus group TaxID=86661 RepID=UPI001BAB01F4|nr:hypothetical protein [Bacillus cereus]MBR9655749.1 hypothetical protein [Bacillus cereus]